MKLSKVIVKNLFGTFNHEVAIKNELGITIIIGENGLGKTVLLELVEGFFNRKFDYINSITFDTLTFEFADKVKWILTKNANIKEDNEKSINLVLTQINSKIEDSFNLELYDVDDINPRQLARMIANSITYLKRITPVSWEDQRNGQVYRANDILENFGYNNTEYPDWFNSRLDKINVTLIKTQRLLLIDQEKQPIHTVEKYSQELSRLINNKLTVSTELSSKIDRTYPNRLIEKLNGKEKSFVSDKELNDNLKELETKRTLLDQVGLFEIGNDLRPLKISKPDDVVKTVLMLYIRDSFEKLAIFNDVSLKIELLLEIINKRFKHKKLHISKDIGFLFKSTVLKSTENKNDYQSIPVNKLSSGEQNELVLFYELIFKTRYDSLILIDEPEISLHISWQNKFIADLKKIHKLNHLDIIIATHSPDIIANNWDLKVELKGVE